MATPSYLRLLRKFVGRHSSPFARPSLFLILLPKIGTFSINVFRPFSDSSSSSSSDDITDLRERIFLLTEKPKILRRRKMLDGVRSQISSLTNELLASEHLNNLKDDCNIADLADFLESRSAVSLLRGFPPGIASVELLYLLRSRPRLAIQVFHWRLKLVDDSMPLVPEEYAMAISLAGRSNKTDLASDLFADANRRGIRSTGMYNSLMAAYMYNGLASKAVSVFEDLGRDLMCKASIVSYNIILSVYGRLMLIDKVETILKQIQKQPHLSPNISTYNILLSAYLTAWMWDRMENIYEGMLGGDVKPDIFTHCLMLRGYAHACNIEKMEKMYELVKDMVNESSLPLVRAMICAYCKSSDKNRVNKVEKLTKHISQDEYRPWLNVIMIRMYAQEGLLDSMEKFIQEAVLKDIRVISIGVMNSIISSYFRCDSIERLVRFISLIESAGWRLCRSLYHCKMVMYGQRNQLKEMYSVLDEMRNYKFDYTKKTFLIMYKACTKAGRRSEAKIFIGMMYKYGFLESQILLLF